MMHCSAALILQLTLLEHPCCRCAQHPQHVPKARHFSEVRTCKSSPHAHDLQCRPVPPALQGVEPCLTCSTSQPTGTSADQSLYKTYMQHTLNRLMFICCVSCDHHLSETGFRGMQLGWFVVCMCMCMPTTHRSTHMLMCMPHEPLLTQTPSTPSASCSAP